MPEDRPTSFTASSAASNGGSVDLAGIIDARLDRKRFQEHHWSGTFWDYLDIAMRTPAVCRNAYQRLYDAVVSCGSRPHYLAFFNSLVGGPGNGWRHLVDSSLDWGQDLCGVARRLQTEAPAAPAYLAYFGSGDPAYEGIRATLLPGLPDFRESRPWRPLGPGVYAISATLLQHVYSDVRGPWTAAWEQEFVQLRALETTLLAFRRDPVRRAELLAAVPGPGWENAWKRYEILRFARLCHYLRIRGPDASVGHSILIFRLGDEEFRAALGGSADDWRRLLERTVAAKAVTVGR